MDHTSSDSDKLDLCFHTEEQTVKGPLEAGLDINQHSLNEFEEIERLIKENTAVDSDDGNTSNHGFSIMTPSTRHESNKRNFILSEQGDEVKDSSSCCPAEGSESSASCHSDRKAEISCAMDRLEAMGNDKLDDDRLVATFGTTEKFEALLEQQLQKMEENDDLKLDQVDNDGYENEAESKNLDVVQSVRRKSSTRTARSPAANRVRKAQKSGLRWHSSLTHESSDDLSVRSDMSRGELRQRLKSESKGRKKEKEVVKQLQDDYDDLLTKYAEAENVIDQLRIGAKINLFAKMPSSGQLIESSQSYSSPDELSLKLAKYGPMRATSPLLTSGNSSKVGESLDSLTENSLQLPSVTSAEFVRVALGQQAKDLEDQVHSFQALLHEGDLANAEKEQVLQNIEKSLNDLEQDYISVGTERESGQRKMEYDLKECNPINEGFDPGNCIEAQICRLGHTIDDLRTNVSINGRAIQSPVSYRQPARTPDICDECMSLDSSEDTDDNFNDLLKRYNRHLLSENEDGHTSAPSAVSLADEESDTLQPGMGNMPRNLEVSTFREPNCNLDLVDSLTQPKTDTTTRTGNQVNPGPRFAHRWQPGRSRLPRLVNTNLTVGRIKQNEMDQNAEFDSGFVSAAVTAGSESSRQSVSTATVVTPHLKLKTVLRSPENSAASVPWKGIGQQKRENVLVQSIPQTLPSSAQIGTKETMSVKAAPTQHDKRTKPKSGHIVSILSPDFHHHFDNTADDSSHTVLELKGTSNSDQDTSTSSTVKEMLGQRLKFSSHGTSGAPLKTPIFYNEKENKHIQKPKPGSETSKPRIGRRLHSGSRDSALDMLRGEIVKLRAEMRKTREQEKVSGTPKDGSGDKQKRPSFESDKQAHRRRQKSLGSSITPNSAPSRQPLRRSESLRRLHQSQIRPSATPTTEIASVTPSMQPQGRWFYVAPPAVRYSCTVIPTITQPPHVYANTSASMPVNGLIPTTLSPARIYITPLPIHTLHAVESSPFNSITTLYSSKGRSYRLTRSHVEYHSDEEDAPLSRSLLNPPRRRSMQYCTLNHRLSSSLDRADEASDILRSKSNNMYHSLRDSMRRAEISNTP